MRHRPRLEAVEARSTADLEGAQLRSHLRGAVGIEGVAEGAPQVVERCARSAKSGIGARCSALKRRTSSRPKHVVGVAVGEEDSRRPAPPRSASAWARQIGRRVDEHLDAGVGAHPAPRVPALVRGRARDTTPTAASDTGHARATFPLGAQEERDPATMGISEERGRARRQGSPRVQSSRTTSTGCRTGSLTP